MGALCAATVPPRRYSILSASHERPKESNASAYAAQLQSTSTKMERSLLLQETPDIEISRKVHDEYLLHSTIDGHSSEPCSRNKHCLYCVSVLTKKLASRLCHWNGISRFLVSLFPIFIWLPKYSIKNDLLADISGGLTVAVMHIPLGNNMTF